MNEIEKLVWHGKLYDFYGPLLNEHQRRIYEEVVLNDYSISEVAEDEGISRQGVHDLIKRCNKLLEDYEAKLGLVKKFEAVCNIVQGSDFENDILEVF